MRSILILLAITLVITTLQSSACGGDDRPIELKWKKVPSEDSQNMVGEKYQYYMNSEGEEVRLGLSYQFDQEQALVGFAVYKHGKVWSGSVVELALDARISVIRHHYEDGEVVKSEPLKDAVDIEGKAFTFRIAEGQELNPYAREFLDFKERSRPLIRSWSQR